MSMILKHPHAFFWLLGLVHVASSLVLLHLHTDITRAHRDLSAPGMIVDALAGLAPVLLWIWIERDIDEWARP